MMVPQVLFPPAKTAAPTPSGTGTPIEDNVCLGVWSQSGSNYKLKHPSWTFDSSGNLTGTAIIGENVTVDAGNNTFSGTYTIDLFDTSGNPVGKYQGTVKATRVMPD